MSKKESKMLVQQLSSVLPDDRPITAINIIEDIDKCPPNFNVVRICFTYTVIIVAIHRKDDRKEMS